MLSRIVRRAARLILPKVEGGGELGQQVALDALPFRAETVIKAFLNGYFPMPGPDGAVQWRNPEQRCLIPINGFHVPKNLQRLVRQKRFDIRVNTCFEEVIRGCAERQETWITDDIISVYCDLHRRGFAHSVEAWQAGELVGGLYGTCIGRFFATESQFHRVRDASKVAFVATFEILQAAGFLIHDVQFMTTYLDQFGATEMPRDEFRTLQMEAMLHRARFRLPEAVVA
ncbi:MAG: leucyl/phenylalanyl-tRNA--protein transferase [Planctomycetota bacterium]|nr:leucyl/phenylalanyl-tRNA--protein transferase [Planctomycetota bacterium]